MLTLLDERYAPITSSIGFLRLPLDDAGAALLNWRNRLHADATAERPTEGFPDVLRRLEPLTGGVRPRELLVSAGKSWTAYFDNSLRGPDAVSTVGYLSRAAGCDGVVIRTLPHTVGRAGRKNGRMGAVQLEMYGPTQTEFLNYVRTISVSYEGGRWGFDVAGRVQPFERLMAYEAKNVRDRFTSEMLAEYCEALGLSVFEPSFYGPDAILIRSAVPVPDGALVMTLAEVQEWLGIVPGQASSLPG